MCRSPVDHRWHSTFIFACARLDIYSVQVGKVRRVSYDGNKQPHQPARVHSPLAARGVWMPLGPAEEQLGSTGHHIPPPSATASAWLGHLLLPWLLQRTLSGLHPAAQGVDNARILEPLSSGAVEEMYYL